MRGEAEKTNLVMTCVNDKNNTIVNHPSNFPSKYKPPTPPPPPLGGLYLEIALKYKVNKAKRVNFLPTIKLPNLF